MPFEGKVWKANIVWAAYKIGSLKKTYSLRLGSYFYLYMKLGQ